MSKKIGFRHYDNEEENEDKEQQQEKARNKAIADFLGVNYAPIGTTSQKCYKTTAELTYDLSNIIRVTPAELAKQLADAGYQVEYIAGQPFWVMYERL